MNIFTGFQLLFYDYEPILHFVQPVIVKIVLVIWWINKPFFVFHPGNFKFMLRG